MVDYQKYFDEIYDRLQDGTERSLYKPLGNFLEEFIKDNFKKDIKAIAEQSSKNYDKPIGFPDIVIKERDFPIGYIEVKLPEDTLDKEKFKEQFNRYRNSLENIIFTNLKNWELWQWNSIGKSIKQKEIIFDITDSDGIDQLKDLFDLFLVYQSYPIKTPKQLAVNLAKKTKLLSSTVEELLEDYEPLQKTKVGFEKTLLPNLTDHDFANLFAETFTYSLFISAVYHHENYPDREFNLTTATDYIPKAIPVLNDMYSIANIAARNLPELKETVHIILNQLEYANLEKIIPKFRNSTSENDPTLYFYEPFLKEYDKTTRKNRAVYLTPKPVINFIVRSIDHILQKDFDLEDGLMNKEVKVLDPATGTGAFLAFAIELIKEKIDNKYGTLHLEKEHFTKEMTEHILENFFAFEFMVASYAIAHFKMNLTLKNLGFSLEDNQKRFKIFLANTLDDPDKKPNSLFGFDSITEESVAAQNVKKNEKIIAIFGNPPYKGSSENPSEEIIHRKKGEKYIFDFEPKFDTLGCLIDLIPKSKKRSKEGFVKQRNWIGTQIEYYKYADFKKLDEKNPKWLQDDYVKFIRFAQNRIDHNGRGVIGYIVNHAFLDNPTFRYMRKSLLDSFDKIYIVNLHGSSKKKEKAPDGSKDENIFQIEQGVCIIIMVKLEEPQNECKILYEDKFGLKKDKETFLEKFDLSKFEEIGFTELKPQSDMYYFIPRNTELEGEYSLFWSVKDIFRINGVGITTAHDDFVIDDKKEVLLKRFNEFKNTERNEDLLHNKFNVRKKKGWDILNGWDNLQKVDSLIEFVQPISYRPFDNRHIFYENKLVWRTVKEVMQHMLKENIGLITARSNKSSTNDHYFCTEFLSEAKTGESTTQSAIFPLYLYSDKGEDLFAEEKEVNFTDEFKKYWKSELKEFSEEDIFYYIYAILYSNNYRKRYNEFLKTDFPRIDFSFMKTKGKELIDFGKQLVDLHLMKSEILKKQEDWNLSVTKKTSEVSKTSEVYKIKYNLKADIYKDNKIYLNPNCYIESIDEEVFNFMIGGYKVLDKFIVDHKDETLEIDELMHYLKIIVIVKETIGLMKKIDEMVEF
ncbi:MAG: type ISP restriction/modification enzyme [Candidatus Cloacimonadales bacterium]|nr:type ISP restriction/modification enzyme [Candidatus Cloacimonadales bacterium]